MHHSNNPNLVALNSVRRNVWSSGYDQLTRPCHTSPATHLGVIHEQSHMLKNAVVNRYRGARAVRLQLVEDGRAVLNCGK
jgi:hypothetical protein